MSKVINAHGDYQNTLHTGYDDAIRVVLNHYRPEDSIDSKTGEPRKRLINVVANNETLSLEDTKELIVFLQSLIRDVEAASEDRKAEIVAESRQTSISKAQEALAAAPNGARLLRDTVGFHYYEKRGTKWFDVYVDGDQQQEMQDRLDGLAYALRNGTWYLTDMFGAVLYRVNDGDRFTY